MLIETANVRTRLCLAHHDAEDSLDVEATLATIQGEPVYQLLPIGLQMVGSDMAERFYRQYLPRRRAARAVEGAFRGMYACDAGIYLDGVSTFPEDESRLSEPQPISCLLIGGETGVIGERIWSTEHYFRYLFGDIFDELEPIPWQRPGA